MSFFSGIGDLLKQYSAGSATTGNEEQHFDQVAQAVPASTLAGGLAEAFRSGQTAPFPEMAAKLFAGGNSEQQAGMLNAVLAAVGPAAISKFVGNAPNSSQERSCNPAKAQLHLSRRPMLARRMSKLSPTTPRTRTRRSSIV